MKFKHVTKTVLNVVLLSMLFSSCGVKNSDNDKNTTGDNSPSSTSGGYVIKDKNVNPPGTFPICKEKISINIGTIANPNVKNYKDNKLTKWYEEKGNFDFSFTEFPVKDAAQKLEVTIASGSKLPDAFVGFTLTDTAVQNYGTQGIIIPLNDYYKNLSVDIKKGFETRKDKNLEKQVASPDGNIYVIGKYNESLQGEYNQLTMINKVWLKNLGLEVPKTTEEFTKVLKAFKDSDPNKNGKKDEIPFLGNTAAMASASDWLMNAFIYDNNTERWTVKNGKVDVPFNKEEWKQGLKYMRELCKDGLLSPLTFTNDQTQFLKALASGSEAQVGVATFGSNVGNVRNAITERLLDYVALPPLTGPNGISYVGYTPSKTTNEFVITKDCKYPEALFRWGDMMWSEDATRRSRWGEPGVDWRDPNSNEVLLIETDVKPFVPILKWGSLQNSHWQFMNPAFSLGYNDGQCVDKVQATPLQKVTISTDYMEASKNKVPKEYAVNLKYTQEESEIVRDIKTTIETYVEQSKARFITGNLDIDKDWDKYVKELDNMDLKKYIEISQKAYDRSKK